MTFTETQSLLDNDDQYGYRIQRVYRNSLDWKALIMLISAAFLPLLIGFTVVQTHHVFNQPEKSLQLLSLPPPVSNSHSNFPKPDQNGSHSQVSPSSYQDKNANIARIRQQNRTAKFSAEIQTHPTTTPNAKLPHLNSNLLRMVPGTRGPELQGPVPDLNEKVDNSSSSPSIGKGKSSSKSKVFTANKAKPTAATKTSVTSTSKPKPKPLHPDPSKVSISKLGNTTIFQYNFHLTEGILSPDNFPQKALLINGQSPGPEIRVTQHSVLLVQITNNLSTEVTIHFHGIHQRKSFLSDGVPMVTQKPIPPGGSYTYEIATWPQVGTFFYHAHTGMDIVWLYGPLVITESEERLRSLPAEYKWDEERVISLNGAYHEPLDKLVERITGPVHSYPATTASILLNGRSYGVWENSTTSNSSVADDHPGYLVVKVRAGLRYRFRFINAASDSILSCQIEGHELLVIETDGIYVEPLRTDRLVISPGQRYSVIVVADQEPRSYRMKCTAMENLGPMNGIAIIKYEAENETLDGREDDDSLLKAYDSGRETLPLDRWVVRHLRPNLAVGQVDHYPVPISIDKEFVMDVFEVLVGEQHVYLINGHFVEEPKIPYFMQLKEGTNITSAPKVIEILEGENIQIVFQNQRTGDVCFTHPWHIHGHSFHVVGEGPDRYDPIKDGTRIQQDLEAGLRSQFRDTVTVYANQTVGEERDGAYCGWAAVRFAAHNPGVWLAHCHVTPHMMMGKRFVIWEHSAEDPFLLGMMNQKKRGRRKDEGTVIDPGMDSGQ